MRKIIIFFHQIFNSFKRVLFSFLFYTNLGLILPFVELHTKQKLRKSVKMSTFLNLYRNVNYLFILNKHYNFINIFCYEFSQVVIINSKNMGLSE